VQVPPDTKVLALSDSGATTVSGVGAATTGSGGMDIGIDASAPVALNVSSQSGKVRLNAGLVQGSVSERRVDGTIGGGGPLLRAESRSGSIDLVSIDARRGCR